MRPDFNFNADVLDRMDKYAAEVLSSYCNFEPEYLLAMCVRGLLPALMDALKDKERLDVLEAHVKDGGVVQGAKCGNDGIIKGGYPIWWCSVPGVSHSGGIRELADRCINVMNGEHPDFGEPWFPEKVEPED